ncbi:Gly-transf-sug domain containing protein [Apiospora arundinis]|uniref:Gly-transf-sug domain containing protein n=1 Tax=Apiospora arundinis TaxID=335852 RepID=A0ABR2J484_9PEZI
MSHTIRNLRGFDRLVLPLICFLLGSLTTLIVSYHPALEFSSSSPAHSLQQYLAPSRDSSSTQGGAATIIPPIVHFVQLKQDQGSVLHFSFEAFLALYAASYHIRPSAIYIHHDFSDEDIANATQHGSSWTKKMLNSTLFPSLRLSRVTAPTEANGHPILRVEHKSDFVRLEQLQRHGGVYLDWDVVVLRPLAPLLGAGFRAVVGRQFDAFINNGIILAVPQSVVVRVLAREAHRVFDGEWITHSVRLLTRVAGALAAVPGEVLIMDFKAFSPFSWEQDSVNLLLGRHPGEAVLAEPLASLEGVNGTSSTSPYEIWEKTQAATARREWVYDFSDAIFLHKIFNSVENPKGYIGVNVPYILARDSNYALATWPIVMEGIKIGLIDAQDDTF